MREHDKAVLISGSGWLAIKAYYRTFGRFPPPDEPKGKAYFEIKIVKKVNGVEYLTNIETEKFDENDEQEKKTQLKILYVNLGMLLQKEQFPEYTT